MSRVSRASRIRTVLGSAHAHRGRLSCPTRRSSDLDAVRVEAGAGGVEAVGGTDVVPLAVMHDGGEAAGAHDGEWYNIGRSEEHTSELQSHHDLVCRLLLEKKNQNNMIDR